MYYINSTEFFDISIRPQTENSAKARLLCLKDFLKRCLVFPFALAGKALKTCFRVAGAGLSAGFVLATLGGSARARELFVHRIGVLAADLADWFLLPLALIFCFLRLILALFIHPNFY